jgi:hypothetical protein
MLEKGQYRVGQYDISTKTVDSGKERQIYRLDYYPHRIIHHSIIQVLETIWTRTLIADTYCCIKQRGVHRSARKLTRILFEDPENTSYCFEVGYRKILPEH